MLLAISRFLSEKIASYAIALYQFVEQTRKVIELFLYTKKKLFILTKMEETSPKWTLITVMVTRNILEAFTKILTITMIELKHLIILNNKKKNSSKVSKMLWPNTKYSSALSMFKLSRLSSILLVNINLAINRHYLM